MDGFDLFGGLAMIGNLGAAGCGRRFYVILPYFCSNLQLKSHKSILFTSWVLCNVPRVIFEVIGEI